MNIKNNTQMNDAKKSIEMILSECHQRQRQPCKKALVVDTTVSRMLEDDLNKIKEETILIIDKNKLSIVPNLGDGNCMFYSISKCLFGTSNKHAFIRHSVFEYYSTFDTTREYKCGGVEEKINLLLMIDDEDTNENEENTPNKHSIVVQYNKEYGNMMDLYVISVLFNINIMILNKFTTDEDKYLIYPILVETATPDQQTIYLKFTNAILHYEAVFINSGELPPIRNNLKRTCGKEDEPVKTERTPLHSRIRTLSLDNGLLQCTPTNKMSFSHILQHGRKCEEECIIIQPSGMHLRSSLFKLSS
jgi:hypothetical protein